MQIPLLTPRLQTIADLIDGGETVADIGTDHAYLPLYLLDQKKCKKAIASDIGIGPLKRAEKTVKKYHMENSFSLRLGSGLETVTLSDNADIIVIAGMGGMVIADILENSIDIVKNAKQIILQPMTMAGVLREYLYKTALGTIDEKLAFENNKVYNIISISINNDETPKTLTPIESYIGKSLIENRPNGFDIYLKRLEKKLSDSLKGMEKSTDISVQNKAKQTKELLNQIKTLKNTEA